LLAGSGTRKLIPLLQKNGVVYQGPFDTLDEAVRAALASAALLSAALTCAVPGCAVVLSPGCASFELFQNEFDRGRKWKDAVRRITGEN
jgi:UDP-N-acetylmuramoylalanine--D-glutamate ligase